MKEYDLEDLAILFSCALNTMEVIHHQLEDCSGDPRTTDAMYSVYVHLRCLSDELTERVNQLPYEIIHRKVVKA